MDPPRADGSGPPCAGRRERSAACVCRLPSLLLSIHRASSRAEGGGRASFLSPSSLLSHRIVLGAAWGVHAAGSYRIIVFRDPGGLEGA